MSVLGSKHSVYRPKLSAIAWFLINASSSINGTRNNSFIQKRGTSIALGEWRVSHEGIESSNVLGERRFGLNGLNSRVLDSMSHTRVGALLGRGYRYLGEGWAQRSYPLFCCETG